jgi:pimeloyl-ACP methyl ester carboxylesterase
MGGGMTHRDYVRLPLPGMQDGALHHTHYRVAGSGPPLLLLHPSPMSSAFMQPLIELLQDQVTVYAPDTPGYGLSDPLPQPAEDLEPYAKWLAAFMQALGLEHAGLHGSATGAQLAIQFARAFPEKADFVVLENAVHFTNAERDDILSKYFPDMSPRDDASHLALAWTMATGLFKQFPWYDEREESRIPGAAPPLGLVHATALAYLNSGVDYARAYKAAFENEKATNLQAITKPTRVIRWQGSILKAYADRLDDFEWPEHIRMVHVDASVEARYQAIKSNLRELLGT